MGPREARVRNWKARLVYRIFEPIAAMPMSALSNSIVSERLLGVVEL
jgi:hypothetical protein